MKLPDWFTELIEQVRSEIDRQNKGARQNRPILEDERDSINRKICGWTQSLGDPSLSPEIRHALQSEWTSAAARVRELEQSLAVVERRDELPSHLVDEAAVLQRLARLADVLGEDNMTRGNLELSLHIDKIYCSVDGKVQLRTCKLGAMPEVVETLLRLPMDEQDGSQSDEPPVDSANGKHKGLRRRAMLRVVDADGLDNDADRAAEFAADSHRFGNLDERFFWVDTFQVPKRSSWVRENAEAVLDRFEQLQEVSGKAPSLNQLAKEFGKSRPTISTALDIAQGIGKTVSQEKGQRKFTPPISLEVREQIVILFDTGELSRNEIASRFGIHRNTVSKILNEAYDKSGQKRPDGRRQRWIRGRGRGRGRNVNGTDSVTAEPHAGP